MSQAKINQLLNRNGENEGDSEFDVENLAHNDERTWLYLDCSRSEAEEILKNKRDGTFLVRKSSTNHYALSIACNGTTNHCIICVTRRGLGFAEPYNIYPTLKDLVLHYATNSLEIHNDSLNTTLKIPYKLALECDNKKLL